MQRKSRAAHSEGDNYLMPFTQRRLLLPLPNMSRQDMRLWIIQTVEDLIVCNDEKLASGHTSSYLHAADNMLRNVIFAEGSKWPDIISAPSFISDKEGAPNFAVKVRIGGL